MIYCHFSDHVLLVFYCAGGPTIRQIRIRVLPVNGPQNGKSYLLANDDQMKRESPSHPLVTIGMPVFNGGEGLRRVLESIVGQTFKDFKLIISDNASTDATQSICTELSYKDKRVTYFRQSQNLGAGTNFDFVLEKADTKYFMWAAADDVRSTDFLEHNVDFLERNPDFIGSTSPVRFDGGEFDPEKMGDQTRDEDDPYERIVRFSRGWHANGIIYSLFRTDVLHDTRCSAVSFLGGDWLLVMKLLADGKLKRLSCGYVTLGTKGVSNSLEVFSRQRTRTIGWLFPFLDLSVQALRLMRTATWRQKLTLFAAQLKLNLSGCRVQIKFELKRSGIGQYLQRRNQREYSSVPSHSAKQ